MKNVYLRAQQDENKKKLNLKQTCEMLIFSYENSFNNVGYFSFDLL